VKCCRRKASERFRESQRGKRARLYKRATAKLLRKQRGTRNGSGAAAAQKTRFHNALAFQAHRKLKNIPANGIAHFHFRGGAGKLTGIARILKMIENSVAKHQRKYRKLARTTQCAAKPRNSGERILRRVAVPYTLGDGCAGKNETGQFFTYADCFPRA
jgi:hypothetical protein